MLGFSEIELRDGIRYEQVSNVGSCVKESRSNPNDSPSDRIPSIELNHFRTNKRIHGIYDESESEVDTSPPIDVAACKQQ